MSWNKSYKEKWIAEHREQFLKANRDRATRGRRRKGIAERKMKGVKMDDQAEMEKAKEHDRAIKDRIKELNKDTDARHLDPSRRVNMAAIIEAATKAKAAGYKVRMK